MKKSELHKLGWNRVDVPDWLPNFLTKLNDTKKIFSLYQSLVNRDAGHTFLQYRCIKCDYSFPSQKLGEEISGCKRCDSGEVIASISYSFPEFHKPNAMELIGHAQSNLTSMLSIYHNKTIYVDPKDYGFTKEGYYFKFNRGSVGIELDLTTAIMKAAISLPELWDFKFNWDKFGVKTLKFYRLLSCLT